MLRSEGSGAHACVYSDVPASWFLASIAMLLPVERVSDDTATGIEGVRSGFGVQYSFANVAARAVVESVRAKAGAANGRPTVASAADAQEG
jgi:hypothetical protein